MVREAAHRAGIDRRAIHDLRRTCARLGHLAGGELDQIQFLLGHVSIQTTERYLGCKQKLGCAVNDTLGIEPDCVAWSPERQGREPESPPLATLGESYRNRLLGSLLQSVKRRPMSSTFFYVRISAFPKPCLIAASGRAARDLGGPRPVSGRNGRPAASLALSKSADVSPIALSFLALA